MPSWYRTEECVVQRSRALWRSPVLVVSNEPWVRNAIVFCSCCQFGSTTTYDYIGAWLKCVGCDVCWNRAIYRSPESIYHNASIAIQFYFVGPVCGMLIVFFCGCSGRGDDTHIPVSFFFVDLSANWKTPDHFAFISVGYCSSVFGLCGL